MTAQYKVLIFYLSFNQSKHSYAISIAELYYDWLNDKSSFFKSTKEILSNFNYFNKQKHSLAMLTAVLYCDWLKSMLGEGRKILSQSCMTVCP